jgi:O-antigen/teichoic acid export membrane protein
MPFVERVLIQRYTDAESLGVYAALYDMIFRGSGMVVMPIVMALHPRIMALGGAGDEAGAKNLIIRGIGLQVLALVLVVAFLWFAGRWIVNATIGPQVSGDIAYRLVIPLAMSGCLWHIALLSHKLLECRRKTGVMTAALACSISAMIGCNMFALPIVGAVGSAYASAIGAVVYCLLVAGLSVGNVTRGPLQSPKANA